MHGYNVDKKDSGQYIYLHYGDVDRDELNKCY